jgi:hypothetical protein
VQGNTRKPPRRLIDIGGSRQQSRSCHSAKGSAAITAGARPPAPESDRFRALLDRARRPRSPLGYVPCAGRCGKKPTQCARAARAYCSNRPAACASMVYTLPVSDVR